MARVIAGSEGRAAIWIWARKLDAPTLSLLERLAARPWVVDRVASMPDAHVSEGVAVGTVFATEHVAVPAALGGDLGCGIAAQAYAVDARALGRAKLEEIHRRLALAIPVGDARHRGRGVALPAPLAEARLSTGKLEHARDRQGPLQLGTLGGGNHFIELDRDSGGRLWAMVHSGSRGVGAAIFAHHRRVAELAEASALAGLDARRPEGAAYLGDLALAVELARANRRWMMDRITEVIADTTGGQPEPEERLDVVHNFIRREVHQDRPLLVHRKGATTAAAGELAVIPGSMGTASFVVRGRGEVLSYASCSHGAGRVMSRAEAHRRIAAKDLARSMRGVVYDPRMERALVEEAPAAYRDVREVLEDQADLVEPLLRLVPIAVLKG